MGSHVRVGLEDSLYLGKGQIAESNASQVTKIRGILEADPLEVATPAEAGRCWASRARAMWATEGHPEHEGITGVTFDSDGHRLVGTLYLARGEEPKPTALLLHGCPGFEKNLDLAAALRDRGWNALVFHYRGCWGSAGRYDLRTIPRDVTAAVGYLAGQGTLIIRHQLSDC